MSNEPRKSIIPCLSIFVIYKFSRQNVFIDRKSKTSLRLTNSSSLKTRRSSCSLPSKVSIKKYTEYPGKRLVTGKSYIIVYNVYRRRIDEAPFTILPLVTDMKYGQARVHGASYRFHGNPGQATLLLLPDICLRQMYV